MHIAIVTTQLGPFSTTNMGADVASLADAFLAAGHTVTAVAPLPTGVDPATYSLARRLTPVVVEVGRKKVEWVRYEVLSSTGINAILLSMDDGNNRLDESFADASATLLASLSDEPDWCICWGPMTAELSAANRTLKCLVHMAGPMTVADARGISSATVVTDDGATSSADNRAVVVRGGVAEAPKWKASDKENAKSTFQLKVGLPVDNSVPLIACTDFDKALASMVSYNVQVVAIKNDTTSALVQRYRDRLTLVDSKDQLPMLALDAVIVGNDSAYAAKAMLHGAVPIVDQRASDALVDIDPTLQSGCVYSLRSDETSDILGGVGRLISAYGNANQFKALCARLPGYVTTWSTVAGHYLQLMEEANK